MYLHLILIPAFRPFKNQMLTALLTRFFLPSFLIWPPSSQLTLQHLIWRNQRIISRQPQRVLRCTPFPYELEDATRNPPYPASTRSTLLAPISRMFITISSFNNCIALSTPGNPYADIANRNGRPIPTPVAPRQRALMISVARLYAAVNEDGDLVL